MTKPRVLVTHWVHPEVIEYLAQTCEVVANTQRTTWPRSGVLELALECDALMAFMPDSIDDDFLAQCPRLKIVAASLKGFDNFDIAACTRRGIWFTRVADLLTIPTAELAIALTLAVTRRILEGDDHARSGTFNGWRPQLYGTGLTGRTAGLIGMGAVGRALVERLAAFGVRVVYADPQPVPPDLARRYALERKTLTELLETSDFVFPLVHLTSDTLHLIDREALGRMKRGAFLINVGRGSVVDEAAVAESLAAGHLAGYAADVFEIEDWALASRPREIHAALLANRAQTFFTPHIGSAVDDVRLAIAMEAARNIVDALQGRRPAGAMNEPLGVSAT